MSATYDFVTHPDEEQLFGLANHLATEEGEELVQLEEHVAQCAECQGTIAELAGVVVRRREPPPEMLARFRQDLAQDAAERAARQPRRAPWGLLLVAVIMTAAAVLWAPEEPARKEIPSVPRRTEPEERPADDMEPTVTVGHQDDAGRDGIACPASPGR